MSSYTTMDESFTNENEIYYANSNFSNYPMFTEQELYCFLPAEQNIYQNTDGAVYPQFATGYYDNGIVPMQDCYSMGIQDGYMSAEEDAFSCQPSPFLEQQYPRSSFMNNNGSPITPSGSPLASEIEYYHNSVPSYMLVPGYQNDQVQEYNSYDVPAAFNSSSVPSLASSISSQDTILDSPCMSSPALGSPGSDGDEDEEEEYENDLSLLPNQGNKELRGMGLYDSPPDLLYTNCSTPTGCSPVSPHATLGKGLVLERSFGLPDEMMIKDESSGKIVKGKLEAEEDDEEPMMYDEEECGEWDGTYQNTFQPQYDISFYASQTNRGW
jgi:hypothetical protein